MNFFAPPAEDHDGFFSSPLALRPSRCPNPAHTTGASQFPPKPANSFGFQGTNNTNFSQKQNTENGINDQNNPSLRAPRKWVVTNPYLPGYVGPPHHFDDYPRYTAPHQLVYAHPSYITRPNLASLLRSLNPAADLEAAYPIIHSPDIPHFTTPKSPEPTPEVLEAFNAMRLMPAEEWLNSNVMPPPGLAEYLARHAPIHDEYGSKYMRSFVPYVNVEDGSKRENVRFLIADNRGNRKQRLRKKYVRVEDVQQKPLPVMPERKLGEYRVQEVIEDDGGQYEEGDVL